LPFFLKIPKVGSGVHYGGTIPMSKTPTQFESDIFGKPYGLLNIHAVDSTIFPSIPATPITFPIMANAYRIATEVDL